MAARSQEAQDFAHYENLDAIRKRPSMYLGSLAPEDGVWTVWREILDNSVDELTNRDVKRPTIIARYLSDGYFEVLDNGGGIPTDPMPGHKIPVLEFVTSRLHSGGKFGTTDVNQNTRGTHGVGLKGATALSNHALVMSFRAVCGYCAEYRDGRIVGKTIQELEPDFTNDFRAVFMTLAKTEVLTGTWVRFRPDTKNFFTTGVLRPDQVESTILERFRSWAEISVGLHPGLSIHLQFGDDVEVFHNARGVRGMVQHRIALEALTQLGPVFEYHANFPEHGDRDAWGIDLVLAFTNYDGFGLRAYTNSLLNSEGGTHETAVLAALATVLKRYCLRDKDHEAVTNDNLRRGLIGVLNIHINGPLFGSQTKDKLVDTRVSEPCQQVCNDAFTEFFLTQDVIAKKLVNRCQRVERSKTQYAKTQAQYAKLADALKRARMPFPIKLRQAPDCTPEERELYVVDGDLSGGTATLARDSRFQEVLPIQGTIINAMRAKNPVDAVLSNKPLLDVLIAMGYNPELRDPLSRLRIGKLVLLTDPDFSGHQLRALFYAMFHTFMPQMMERGVLFQARTYEYMVHDIGGDHAPLLFGDSIEELAAQVTHPGTMKNVVHLRGWGEIDSSDLSVLAFDPRTRVLERIMPTSPERTDMFCQLMGTDKAYRARLLGVEPDANILDEETDTLEA